ncbi:MAG: hypothetical protein HZA21_00935 [Nitrospirae bacterium]|nr:hypothetical protein [Nitrospirota bacterium]
MGTPLQPLDLVLNQYNIRCVISGVDSHAGPCHSTYVKLNEAQREATSKTFLDLAKLLLATFVIGALIPNSPVTTARMLVALACAVALYVAAMLLLGGDRDHD